MPRGGRKKGADTHKYDQYVVPMLQHLCRVARRERGWSKFTTIRKFVEAGPGLGGKSVNATVHRLYQKMQSGRYGEVKLPPGVRWSRFTLEPLKKRRRRSKSK
jgi:hypothetical protein